MFLYYITDRRQFPGSPAQQRDRLLAKIAEAARAGVDLIQLRERDLSARELYVLAAESLAIIREMRNAKRETRLLINSRLDVALACGADGVHLRGDDFSASDARAIWAKSLRLQEVINGTGAEKTGFSRNVKRETRNASFLFGRFLPHPSRHSFRRSAWRGLCRLRSGFREAGN